MSLYDFTPLEMRRDLRRVCGGYFDRYLKPGDVVYDIGCGTKPFAPLLAGKVGAHIGVDVEDGFYDSSHIDLVGSAYAVPAADGTADAVISSQVIEHLERPRDALRETARLLKKDGLLFLSFPFIYPLHAAPRDFFRYTEFGMTDMLKAEGFEIVEKTRIGGFWYCVALFFGVYLKLLDAGILKKIRLVPVLNFLIKWPFYAIHCLEGWVFRIAGKNPGDMRRNWTINYVMVARKS